MRVRWDAQHLVFFFTVMLTIAVLFASVTLSMPTSYALLVLFVIAALSSTTHSMLLLRHRFV